MERLTQGIVIAGIDEAGRGPLVGAVLAAAVILPTDLVLPGLTDSKKLTEKKREVLFDQIQQQAIDFGIASASAKEIDKYNILQASLLAMQRAFDKLKTPVDAAWIGGNKAPHLSVPTRTIIKGDSLVAAISAASILAKVTRDRQLYVLDQQYPEYGFGQHKGYPTKMHLQAIEKHGLTPEHRLSFGPCKTLVNSIEMISKS